MHAASPSPTAEHPAASSPASNRLSRIRRHLHLRRNLLILAVSLLLLAVAAQLLATPLASHFTRKSLREMEGFRGNVGKVTASVFPPRYTMRELELWDTTDRAAKEPLLKVEHLRMGVAWRKLLDLQLVATAWVFKPQVNLVQRSEREDSPQSVQSRAEALPRLAKRLEQLAPLKVDDFTVANGRIVFQDRTEASNPTVKLTDLDARLRNFATRPILLEGEPTTLDLTARLQGSGRLKAHASADPFQKKLHFDARASLLGLEVKELAPLTEASTGLHASQGTLDMFLDVKARDAQLSGGIKPILKNVELATMQPSLFDKLKAWVADKGLDILSDDRDRAATVVPIEGTVDVAEAQLWPTLFGVVRNAFVEGVTAGFGNLPPRKAPSKEGLLEQAWKALGPGGSGPQAQPQDGEAKKEQVKGQGRGDEK